jgi:hypothetical protein
MYVCDQYSSYVYSAVKMNIHTQKTSTLFLGDSHSDFFNFFKALKSSYDFKIMNVVYRPFA